MRHRLALFVAFLAPIAIPACGGSDLPAREDASSLDVIVIVPDAEPPADAPPDGPAAPDAPGVADASMNPDAAAGSCGSVSIAAGVTVTASSTGLTNMTSGSCGGASAGEAVYFFDLASMADLIVTTDLPGTDFNTAVYVRTTCDAPGTEEGCAGGGMLGDALTLLDLAPGTYYIFVDGVAGATGNYELLVTVRPIIAEGGMCDPTGVLNRCETGATCVDSPTGATCQTMASACEIGAITVTPGVTVTGDTTGIADTYGPGCSFDAGAGELVYRVDIPAGAYDLIATATPSNFGVDMFDAILTAETVCGDLGSEVDCADAPTASAAETIVVLDATGTYFLLVDGYNGTEGQFTLDVTLRPVLGLGAACDPAGTADRCGGSLDCLPDAGGGTTCQDPFASTCSGAPAAVLGGTANTGTIDPAAVSDLSPTCAFDSGDGESIYSVSVTAAGTFLIVDETTAAGSEIYVRGPDTCAPTSDIACDTGTVRSLTTPGLAPGTYYIIVDGSGAYSLTVETGLVLGPAATCDPFSATARCDAGTWCFDNACTALTPVIDMAPNFNFCDAQGPFAGDFVVDGDISGAGDGDNFEITLAATTDLVITTTDGLGCGVNTVIDVYSAGGASCTTLDSTPQTPIASDDNSGLEGICSQLTLTALAAGTYYVRVTRPATSTATGPYFLTVDFQ